jgi:DNA-binding CsgD family transcriptional regulator
MATSRPARVGTLRTAAGILRATDGAPPDSSSRMAHQRRLVADLCRMLDPQPGAGAHGRGNRGTNGKENRRGHSADRPLPAAAGRLSPRMGQTLERLLAGDSEKEIAARFGRSRHTVHVYVKKLYQRFGVSSRGELFALFVRPPAPPTPPPPDMASPE